MSKNNKVSPAPDQRDLRTICLSIEATVKNQLPAAPAEQEDDDEQEQEQENGKRRLHFPVRLSDAAVIALDIVLSDLKARAEANGGRMKHMDYTEIIKACNEQEAGCMNKGGYINESIRARCAEILGVKVRWAR